MALQSKLDANTGPTSPAVNKLGLAQNRTMPNIMEQPVTPDRQIRSSDNKKSKNAVSKLKHQLALIDQDQQALRLRYTKLDQEQEDEGTDMMLVIAEKVNNEVVLVAQERQARKLRMAEIEKMNHDLNHFLKAERLRKTTQDMAQEMLEEDAEALRMRIKLAKEVQQVETVEAGTIGRNRKRKAVLEETPETPSKKPYVLIPSSQPEVDYDCDFELSRSRTVRPSTGSPEIHETLQTGGVNTYNFPNPTTPKHLRQCRICGKGQCHSVGKNGKGVVCGCIPMFKVMWQVNGGIDGIDDLDNGSDDETIGALSQTQT